VRDNHPRTWWYQQQQQQQQQQQTEGQPGLFSLAWSVVSLFS
jgi:hypothetical protein